VIESLAVNPFDVNLGRPALAPSLAVLAVVTACLGAPTAVAQSSAASQAEVQRLGEYIRTPDHLKVVGTAIATFEPTALQAQCKDVKPVKGRSWQPVEEPKFEGPGPAPTNAAWQESWDVTVCGRPEVRNIGFVARPGQPVVPFPMFPGTSLADLKLQADAGQMALDTVAPGALNCPQGAIQVIASTVTNRAEFARGKWSERWTVAGCGHTADIDVDFLPGPNGRPTWGFRAGKAR